MSEKGHSCVYETVNWCKNTELRNELRALFMKVTPDAVVLKVTD